jgi:hypothetical protein
VAAWGRRTPVGHKLSMILILTEALTLVSLCRTRPCPSTSTTSRCRRLRLRRCLTLCLTTRCSRARPFPLLSASSPRTLAVRKVESLALQLRTDPPVPDIEHKSPVRRIAQVPVPAVLPRRFFPDQRTRTRCTRRRTSRCAGGSGRTRASRKGWDTLGDSQEFIEQCPLWPIYSAIYLAPHRLPHLVECVPGIRQLASEPGKVRLYAELVVARCIPEMQACTDSQVGLERQSELGKKALATWGGVREEETGFGGVVHPLGGVDELADLEGGSPHRSASAGDRGCALAIIEELVRYERTPETQKTQTNAADVQSTGSSLVEHGEVRDDVAPGPELLEHADVFAGAPEREHGHVETQLAGEQQGKLGEQVDGDGLADERGRVVGREEVGALGPRDEGRVLGQVAEGAVADTVEGG